MRKNSNSPENSFDVVMAQYVVTAVPQSGSGARRVRRVLRPGGRADHPDPGSAPMPGCAGSSSSGLQPGGASARFPHRRIRLVAGTCNGWLGAHGMEWFERRLVPPLGHFSLVRIRKRHGGRRLIEAAEVRVITSFVSRSCDISMMSHRRTSNPIKTNHPYFLGERMIKNFREQLRIQRWDDHRYYHHSRINQSLHFISALSFLIGYAMMFFDPLAAALIGWLVSMTSRQAGHFFFEPRGYDHINQATHEHKEDIKVGYNLRRKIVLMTIWAASPLVLYFDPTLFGMFTPWASPVRLHAPGRQIWLVVASVACCSAPCSCSSSAMSRRAWSG
jgi:hypothetical protein